MSKGQNDTHIHSVEDNHGHGKDRADNPNDHNHLVINFLNMILLIEFCEERSRFYTDPFCS